VWDGNQILYEISSKGATSASATELEQDTAQVNYQENEDYEPYGRVVYTHGAGLDAPLGLIRVNFSDVFPQPTLVLPLANWEGQYDMGIIAGYRNPSPAGANYCQNYPPPGGPLRCFQIDWPAPYMWKTLYSRSRGVQGPRSWNGSLIEAGRDNTGQMYRRNRYYDPATGRFTQEDLIGLAGGLNLYGFANGDPVNFADPFGVCADSIKNKKGLCPGGLTDKEWDRVEYAANNRMTAAARERVLGLLKAGKIHAGLRWFDRILTPTENPAGVTYRLGDVHIAEDVFEYQPGNFAMLLAHESQHTVQSLLMGPTMKERDADAYGCSNTWGRTESYTGGTYGDQFGNYCGGPP